MKKSLRTFKKRNRFALLSTLIVAANPLHAATPPDSLTAEQQAVLKPLQLMCEGLETKDATLIQSQLLPGGMATQIRDAKPVKMHFDPFIARLKELFKSSSDQFKETLYHPVIHIDHDIAVIWAPYVFTVNGKMDHCGTNVFTMYNEKGNWLVSNVADNGRHGECPAA